MAVAATAAWLCAASGPANASGSLVNPQWSVSSPLTSTSGVSATFTFTTATTASLDAVQMVLSTAGTGGSPTVGTVSPSSVATGGAVSLSGGTTLTYTFTAATISAGTPVSIQVNGLQTPGAAGADTATITTCSASSCSSTVDTGTAAPPVWLAQHALTSPAFAATSTASGGSASYTYSFTTGSTANNLNRIVMGVPPGTGGTPAVGTVSGVPSGGSVSTSSNTLTYTFTQTNVNSGTVVSVQITGLTNTSYAGSYKLEMTDEDNGGSFHDAGYAAAVSITGTLTSPAWSASSTTTGATSVSYTYSFTTASNAALNKVTMTVPSGTGGSAAVGTVTPASVASGGSVSLAGTTLTYTFTTASVSSGTAVSIQITGLTNTSTAGAYTSTLSTLYGTSTVDTGVTPSVTLGVLSLTAPSSLTWSATLNGIDQNVVDGTAADQQFTVSDTTGSGAGWHITVSATTMTTGTRSLPSSGTLSYTGSVTSASATTAPTATCNSSCTLPTDTTTYPVAITTAASSPPTVTLYDTAASTGLGAMTIGGSTASHPGGWWLSIPAKAYAGSYTTTVTVSIVSGP